MESFGSKTENAGLNIVDRNLLFSGAAAEVGVVQAPEGLPSFSL